MDMFFPPNKKGLIILHEWTVTLDGHVCCFWESDGFVIYNEYYLDMFVRIPPLQLTIR